MKNVTVLGATGSIGVNTLDVISRHADKYKVIALSANTQVDRLYEQCVQFVPDYAVMRDEIAASKLEVKIKQAGLSVKVLHGEQGLCHIAGMPETDYVMAAIVGAAGLESALEAARKGKRVLLANKESLVMSGKLFMDAIEHNNAELLPIDSEHNAIFQCLPADYKNNRQSAGVQKILLTGSGGPFRDCSIGDLAGKTPEEAIAHPNWDMGKKISVDSATMMNKGLELIEACWLFDVELQDIDVVLHPQSIIHSMVEYQDGSILAQLGQPDMRTPIAHALAWPQRMNSGVKQLDLFDIAELSFERPEYDRYPCLKLARDAMQAGGTSTCILNAANEIAVAAFLDRQLIFTDIANIVEQTLSRCSATAADDLETILQADTQAREIATELVNSQQVRTIAR